MSSGARGSNTNVETFEIFFLGWFSRQEHYLALLLAAQQHIHEEHELKALISRVLEHYQQYYEQKSKIAQHNVLLCFSPTWMSSFERAFLWIGSGFKLGLAFKISVKVLHDLSEEEISRIRRLVQEIKIEERALEEEFAKVQESVAAPPLIEEVKRRGGVRLVDGLPEGRDAMDTLKAAMENVLTNASLLRAVTATKLMEILRPQQTVKFLAAAAQLHIKIRSWGMEKDSRW